MTVQNSFMFNVWENIKDTLETLMATSEFKVAAVGGSRFKSQVPVSYGEQYAPRPDTYIELNDVTGIAGGGFKYRVHTSRGINATTRMAEGIFKFNINVRRKDPEDCYKVGWRIFEAFENKLGSDITLGFDFVGNPTVSILNYEIDEVYQNIELNTGDSDVWYLQIDVRLSVEARITAGT